MKRALWGLLVLAAACGSDAGTAVATFTVDVEPRIALAVGQGSTVQYRALVFEGERLVTGASVSWATSDGAIASVSAEGLVTGVRSGTTAVTATLAGSPGASGSATLDVWVPPAVGSWQPGTSYFGRKEYVEYIPGELPLVISAPHGGALEPAEIPDRTVGTTVTDSRTVETILAVRDAFIERTGKAPHVVISHLKRIKLDPNREIGEAAQDNPFAELAWAEFQEYIEVAEAAVVATYGSGFYIDLHGHGHEIARAELGYLLSSAELGLSDAALDAGGLAARSSVRDVAGRTSASFSELLRGATSLGGLLAAEGVAAVPSPADPSPGSAAYFTGGYNTDRHGSRRAGQTVSGVQIELPLPGIRDSEDARRAFGRALAASVQTFMVRHWGFFAP